jgi:hypothetical protein
MFQPRVPSLLVLSLLMRSLPVALAWRSSQPGTLAHLRQPVIRTRIATMLLITAHLGE